VATNTHKPDPVKNAQDTPGLRHALERACAERGLSTTGARLIHRYSNAVYLLPSASAIARITSEDVPRAQRMHAVTEWLVDQAGVAATAPLRAAPPVAADPSTTVSFWIYYPQPDTTTPLTSTHLARILRPLHAIQAVPFELEAWQPLASLSAALRDPVAANNLAAADLDWLRGRVDEVRAQVLALDSPLGHGVIHGDAWAGNLLWNTAAGPDAAVLGDWDWVSTGPREVDLIPTWHAAVRYGKGEQWADAFVNIYGYDLATWDGFSTLLAMRDLVQLTGPLRRAGDGPEFATALRQRLDGIQSGDIQVTWKAL
jgi:hypothetical protein